jgi:hypothetical protein
MVQSAILLVMVGVLNFIPRDYFETGLYVGGEKSTVKPVTENVQNTQTVESNPQAIPNDQSSQVDSASVFQYPQNGEQPANHTHPNQFFEIFSNIRAIFGYKVYLASAGAIITLIHVVTTIEFWISNYLLVVMEVDPAIVSTTFIITCVTAPTLGVLTGGIVVQRYGGYEEKFASIWCIACGSVSCVCAVIIPFFNNIIGFGIFLWIFFFFGGAVVPNINGILLSALPSRLRGTGSSLNMLCMNAFGMLPAPYIYSAIYDATSGINKKLALTITINYAWIALALMVLSMWLRFREDQKADDGALNKKTYVLI